MKRKIPERIGNIETDVAGRILSANMEPTEQGLCYKDWEAFYYRPNDPCYVGEYSEIGDWAWTHQMI